MNTSKTHFTAKEIAEMRLSSAPQSHYNVTLKAQRENWQSRPRVGKGGGKEYALDSLPDKVQAEIHIKLARQGE